ncbi:hypothetical protein TNCV_2710981 [Trichonephila clavipes]|nr:hypothetical protein TNCV_2710981 [Trichonephila clavipes]
MQGCNQDYSIGKVEFMRTEKGFLYNQEHEEADIEHVLGENLLYFRIANFSDKEKNLLGKKNGTIFAKRFKCDIILGFNVLPPTQTYPKRVAGAHLVTRDTTTRIIRHENLELAKKFSNALDTGCAYVQSKRIFASSYKQSHVFEQWSVI